MPTGYTCGVQDGTLTDFPTFALQCARAFGAMVTLREEPLDAPLPDSFGPEAYYVERVTRAEVELGRVLQLTPAECKAGAETAHADAVRYRDDYLAKKKEQRARYAAMLAKAKAWKAPSPDHAELAKFMVDQLKDSIRSDCGDYVPKVEPLLSGQEWKYLQVSRATEELERARKSLAEEETRAHSRSKWLRELRESLRGEV